MENDVITPTAAQGRTAEEIIAAAEANKTAKQTEDAFGDTAAYLAEDSFESALQRLENAGTRKGIAGYMREPGSLLEQGYNTAVGYLADTGLAGVELSDAALKYAIGLGTELVPFQDAQEEQRLARDLAGMVDYAAMASPANVTSKVDDTLRALPRAVPEFVRNESGAVPIPRFRTRGETAPVPHYEDIKFSSPTLETIDNITYPKDGIFGSSFISELKSTKGVRPAELSAMELKLEPKRRYTKEELRDIVAPQVYDVTFVDTKPRYQDYQRMFPGNNDAGGIAPIQYFEWTADAKRPSGGSIKPNRKHYDSDNILFHTRGTVGEDIETGNRVYTVEELQSDLLQGGFSTEADTTKYDVEATDFFMGLPDYMQEFMYQPETVDKVDSALLKWQADYPQLGDFVDIGTPEYDAHAATISANTRELEEKLRSAGLSEDAVTAIAYDPTDTLYDIGRFREIEKLKEAPVKPPIKDIKETVRMSVDGLIGKAQQNGWDSIYFPPLEQIAAKRFEPGSAQFYKAITPGSGFHNTYVRSLNPILDDTVASAKGAFELQDVSRDFTPGETYYAMPDEDLVRIKDDMGKVKKLIRAFNDNMTDEEIYDKLGIDPMEFANYLDTEYDVNLSVVEDAAMQGDSVDYIMDNVETRAYENASLMYGQQRPLDTNGKQLNLTEGASAYDFTRPTFAEGGVVTNMDTQMNTLMAEGGLNTGTAAVDPVSGNEVPPGSTPSEVRDDIDARLSEGEYVVPADVVKYFGVAFFEGLRNKAKEGLAGMHRDGRIGGGPAPMEDEEDDALPFDIAELQTTDAQMEEAGFAAGGMVGVGTPAYQAPATGNYVGSSLFNQPQEQKPQAAVAVTTKTYVNATGQTIQIKFDAQGNPLTPIPAGYVEQTAANAAAKRNNDNNPVGMGARTQQTDTTENGSMGRLKVEDFASPASAIESFRTDLNQMGKTGTTGSVIGGIVGGPIGGLIGNVAGRGYQLAEARAKIQVARAYGYDDAADTMEAELKSVTDQMGIGSKAILDAIAPGTSLANRFLKANPVQTTVAPTVTAQPAAPKPKRNFTKAAGPVTTGQKKDRTGIMPKAGGSVSLSAAKPSAPRGGGGRAKGGLVTKPDKK